MTEMRAMGASAALISAVVLLLPSRYASKTLFSFMLVLMSLYITGLAYAGGVVRGDLTILFTFVVVFSAYFFPWRTSAAHLSLIAILVASRLFLVGEASASQVEPIRAAILMPALVSVWALVTVLRRSLVEREARLRVQEIHDLETGLLTSNGLEQSLDAELSRAARHARPLSLIYLEAAGPALAAVGPDTTCRVATTIARALVSRIRAEDRAARIGKFKFAVLAAETGETGAAAMGRNLAEQVRKRMLSIGYEGDSFSISAGWADYHYDELSKHDLAKEADRALGAAILQSEGIAFPPVSEPEATPAPVTYLSRAS
jgi:diguanylate cyclase (GGDEF)-like protein